MDVKEKVYGFIRDVLLCVSCDKPEVKLKCNAIKGIKQSCKACGEKGYLAMALIEDILNIMVK
jgi:hypothetical protein